MRIATMVKGYLTVPAPLDIVYAPADLALHISNGLIDRGHSVDFYAPEGSSVDKAQLVTRNLRSLANTYKEFQEAIADGDLASDNVLATWDYYLAEEMFRRAAAGEYDVLLFHHPEVALPFVNTYPSVPVAYIMHDPILPIQQEMLRMYSTPRQKLISISNQQRQTALDLPYLATIYNGIDTDHFVPDLKHKEDYLLFLGSILPRKGTKEAVEVALKSGKRLVIAGPTYPAAQDYFDKYVGRYVDSKQITYLGHVPHNETVELFQKAAAFLMPIQWEEPFGLTMVEALACSTPVVALKRGSVPEIIEHGKTGFIAESVDEMVEAVKNINTIDPAICRSEAVSRFSIDAMVNAYEAALQDFIKS
jgi:glycosyltransferase involved in cell wall biosynthesis